MVFLRQITLPDEDMELGVIYAEKKTCYTSAYPFRIFPQKGRRCFDFAPVTLFCGGNGSGKTTLLNIIAEKLSASRHSAFNNSAFFKRYTDLCRVGTGAEPGGIFFLSSDDVFDYVLNIRHINSGFDDKREKIFAEYCESKKNVKHDPSYLRLNGLEDYDRWKEVYDSVTKTASRFVRERVSRNIDMYSNGETAMRYFTEMIDRDSLYLIDEPENSLSVKHQEELADFIRDSARFFNCQFIIATHSPVFLATECAEIYDLDSVPVEKRAWTDIRNVRDYFEFFQKHRDKFTHDK